MKFTKLMIIFYNIILNINKVNISWMRINLIYFILLYQLCFSKFFTLIKQQSVKQVEICIPPQIVNNYTQIYLGYCINSLYFIQLLIGTPPQAFQFQFDTGSNVLWVPLLQNTGIGFNYNASSTFSISPLAGNISYADNSSVSGFYGTDFVSLPNTNINVQMTNNILFVTQQSQGVQPNAITGLVGMGYTPIPNFLDYAYQMKQIQSPVFALQLQNQSSPSILYYDNIPSSITNNTLWTPVIGDTFWQISVIQLGYNGGAIIDSGTSYLSFPPQMYRSIIQQYFSSCQFSQFFAPKCPCPTTQNPWPIFRIILQGIHMVIYPQNYTIFNGDSQNTCTYAFMTLGGQYPIILGDVFLRNYIVTFDKQNQKIGFNGQFGEWEIIGANYFQISQIILVVLLFLIFALGLFLLFFLRIVKKDRNKKQLGMYLVDV